jgi:hypothetical protein
MPWIVLGDILVIVMVMLICIKWVFCIITDIETHGTMPLRLMLGKCYGISAIGSSDNIFLALNSSRGLSSKDIPNFIHHQSNGSSKNNFIHNRSVRIEQARVPAD